MVESGVATCLQWLQNNAKVHQWVQCMGNKFSTAFSHSDTNDTVLHGMHAIHGCWKEHKAKQVVVATKLGGTRVRWFTDNQNVAHILHIAGRLVVVSQYCKWSSQSIWAVCNDPNTFTAWMDTQGKNQLADYLRHIIDHDDWYLDPSMFARLADLWSPHSVDRLANHLNTQLPPFNSFYMHVLAMRLSIHLPHIGMKRTIDSASHLPLLRHAEVCKAWGTLILPACESSPFWPLVYSNGQAWHLLWRILCPSNSLFYQGESEHALFQVETLNNAF